MLSVSSLKLIIILFPLTFDDFAAVLCLMKTKNHVSVIQFNKKETKMCVNLSVDVFLRLSAALFLYFDVGPSEILLRNYTQNIIIIIRVCVFIFSLEFSRVFIYYDSGCFKKYTQHDIYRAFARFLYKIVSWDVLQYPWNRLLWPSYSNLVVTFSYNITQRASLSTVSWHLIILNCINRQAVVTFIDSSKIKLINCQKNNLNSS